MKIAIYYTKDRNILIKNKKGKILLKRRYRNRGNVFSIPKQQIITKNRLKLLRTKNPNYKLLEILFREVPPERGYNPNRIKIMKSSIESDKACIYPALGNVYIHPEFLDTLTPIERKQVLFHELGHLYYTTEEKADLFAATILFILGYPPHAIMMASRKTLMVSPENMKRWHRILSYLEKAKR